MTLFEQKFITEFMSTLSTILASENELSEAILTFTQNNPQNPRFYLNTKIPNAIEWSYNELQQFSAAYSEALFRVMLFFGQNQAASIEEINAAKELLQSDYIPKITTDIEPGQRIYSIIEKIKLGFDLVVEEQKTPEVSRAITEENPYRFFFKACVATAAIGAAIYLGQNM